MSEAKSSGADTFGGIAETEQASAQSKSAVRRRRIDMQMVQDVLLIWLNSNIDENSADYRNIITQLRRAVDTVNIYNDDEECIKFLESVEKEKTYMIISGSLGQHIVPRVHDMSQVDSIFIFCDNKERHEQWTKEWSKIRGVFTEISAICEILKQTTQECEQNAISVSFMAAGSDNSKKNLDQLDPSFMYTQILKEILLTIKFEEKHITEYIEYCRGVFAENQRELKNVDQLQQNYREHTPIWWYTYECFLYPMLNRALRFMDVNIIIKLGFFINDLLRHLEQLHKEQFGGQEIDKSYIVYRGQGMSKTEFEQMINTKGGLMSFNNFLSTSKNSEVSLGFANSALKNPDLVGILFVITIDPAKSTTYFASVTDVSYFKDQEDEVLFAMQTVFRIHDIKPIGENHRLFQVELILTSDNDEDLRHLTDHIREETFPDSNGWYRLGLMLQKMGHFDTAEEVYEILLDKATYEIEKAPIYHEIGCIKDEQEKYQEAITYYEKSIEIREKTLPLNNRDLALSYHNIGGTYDNMGEYSKALSFYQKDLEISEKLLPPDHPDLAITYNSIGATYDNMDEHSKALSFLEKALEIQQHSLPSNHPLLAISYNNIGLLYEKMDNYSKAHSCYERAVDIGQHSLPSNHPDLQDYRVNLDDIKKKL